VVSATSEPESSPFAHQIERLGYTVTVEPAT
jgi:hypothetical protein